MVDVVFIYSTLLILGNKMLRCLQNCVCPTCRIRRAKTADTDRINKRMEADEKQRASQRSTDQQRRADNQSFQRGRLQSKVSANAGALQSYIDSMQCALTKAFKSSECEDGYFLEKLEKMCNRLGYKLVKKEGYDNEKR